MDNFELEAAMESGEFDAVMSEIKRIDDEAKKKALISSIRTNTFNI